MIRPCKIGEYCVADESCCIKCTRNPINKDIRNYYKPYNPTCRFGNVDCIYDPAYILCNDEKWYHKLYGDITPEEAALDEEGCKLCLNGEHYDDEDK